MNKPYWTQPRSTQQQLQSADGRRLVQALEDTLDTGNSMVDAWDELFIIEDGWEFELAMMGWPQIVENEDGTIVQKDLNYYICRLRELYMERAIEALEAELKLHGDKRQ